MAYSTEINFTSRELSPKEKVMIKDLTNAMPLDKAVEGTDSFAISPDYYAILSIHNDKAKGDKDYTVCIIVDTTGNKYKTGSESFINAFKDIMSEIGEVDEEWELSVYGLPSKNYSGKKFLTCSVI